MIIDYLGHSGFLFETARALLLFDNARKDCPPLRHKPVEKPLFVFVSHAHADHFNPAIFSLADGSRRVRFLLSFDLKGTANVPKGCAVSFLNADESYAVEGLGTVQTLRSTDEGVAFLVKTPDETLFHVHLSSKSRQ